jgi:hypothetical protein
MQPSSPYCAQGESRLLTATGQPRREARSGVKCELQSGRIRRLENNGKPALCPPTTAWVLTRVPARPGTLPHLPGSAPPQTQAPQSIRGSLRVADGTPAPQPAGLLGRTRAGWLVGSGPTQSLAGKMASQGSSAAPQRRLVTPRRVSAGSVPGQPKHLAGPQPKLLAGPQPKHLAGPQPKLRAGPAQAP